MEEKIIYFMCLLMDMSILYEITEICCIILRSLPSWERGLKSVFAMMWGKIWQSLPSWERGLKLFQQDDYPVSVESLPSWERGLKFVWLWLQWQGFCRSLRGSVDWNQHRCDGNRLQCVAPFVGAWIEIGQMTVCINLGGSRSLRGSVDWNESI